MADDFDHMASLAHIEEAWFLVPWGNITFRFGPYTKEEAGKLMKECVEKEAGAVIVYNCGKNFAADFAKIFNKLSPKTEPTT